MLHTPKLNHTWRNIAMAVVLNFFLCLCLALFIVPNCSRAQQPKALVLPVTKHASTGQHIVQFHQSTPLVPRRYSLDLGGEFLWAVCDSKFKSSSYKHAPCNSAQCKLAKAEQCSARCDPFPHCTDHACVDIAVNPVSHLYYHPSEIDQDIVTIQSTDGSRPGRVVSIPKFIMACANATKVLKGLPSNVRGIAGLGRNDVSLPAQFSSAFGFARKFAICLSSSATSNGVVFFGDGPYVMGPRYEDISRPLFYTPLIHNKYGTSGYFHNAATDYYIGVTSIKIDGRDLPFDKSLLSIDNKKGNGGTKFSTTDRYMVLYTPIYKAFMEAYIKVMSHVPRVASVAPFGACYDLTKLGMTPLGPPVPRIDLEMQSNTVVWSIYGANSMVNVGKNVWCLGVVEDKRNTNYEDFGGFASIVIGAHQLENHLLQFDPLNNMVAFSSSLLLRATSCSHFNFAPKA